MAERRRAPAVQAQQPEPSMSLWCSLGIVLAGLLALLVLSIGFHLATRGG